MSQLVETVALKSRSTLILDERQSVEIFRSKFKTPFVTDDEWRFSHEIKDCLESQPDFNSPGSRRAFALRKRVVKKRVENIAAIKSQHVIRLVQNVEEIRPQLEAQILRTQTEVTRQRSIEPLKTRSAQGVATRDAGASVEIDHIPGVRQIDVVADGIRKPGRRGSAVNGVADSDAVRRRVGVINRRTVVKGVAVAV